MRSLFAHLGAHLLFQLLFSAYSPTYWPFFFTCFYSLRFFWFCSHFLVILGSIWHAFLECLGALKMKLPCAREHHYHAVDLRFPGLISRRVFAADFFKTFRIFKRFGAPLGSLLGALALPDRARFRPKVCAN